VPITGARQPGRQRCHLHPRPMIIVLPRITPRRLGCDFWRHGAGLGRADRHRSWSSPHFSEYAAPGDSGSGRVLIGISLPGQGLKDQIGPRGCAPARAIADRRWLQSEKPAVCSRWHRPGSTAAATRPTAIRAPNSGKKDDGGHFGGPATLPASSIKSPPVLGALALVVFERGGSLDPGRKAWAPLRCL